MAPVQKIGCAYLLVLTALCVGTGSAADSDVLVDLPQGKIKGFVKKSRVGRPYYAFQRVPFAAADRFEPPREAEQWEGILDATGKDSGCAQTFWVSNQTTGKEACLEVYIHTPKLDAKMPVMVFFHGGGLTIGSPSWFNGGYLVDEDVVFVGVGYRLGALGFLSTGDDVIPGNLGLKDQSFALKWVQKHIGKFGGDPHLVTIFGMSAGGASVNYHLLSPLSTGLFHRAIAMSGSSFNPWAFSWNPRPMAEKYAKNVGCPSESSREMLKCLKGKSLQELLDGMIDLAEWGYDPFTPFGAVVEARKEDAFLSDFPETLMREGRFTKVPLMTGIAQDEGIMMHSGYVRAEPKLMQDLKDDWERVFPITFEYDRIYTNLSKADQKAVSKKIKEFYFHGNPVDENTLQELTDVYSDRLFNVGVKKLALLAALHTPTYIYKFTQERVDYSSLNLIGYPKVSGVGHADDLSFLFSQFHLAPEFKTGSEEETVSKNYAKIFASFAKNGKPTATWGPAKEWPPVSQEEVDGTVPLKFYKVAFETELSDDHFPERYLFWENLLRKFPYTNLVKDEL